MKNYLGEQIHSHREVLNMTQDQFGSKYSVSGPAIFKFEKGYVKPSLELWLKMAKDFDIPQRKAVLLWVKSKLPEEYQDFIDLTAEVAAEAGGKKGKAGPRDYSTYSDRDDMRAAVKKDAALPKGLRDLLADDELWAVYRPTGREINILRDTFGQLGKGTKAAYREALRLIREFTGLD
ncbi:MAG: helix-turn-helix domain-containing protein [Candidatus Sumerlaeota bacterium]|nr:helix-turn-helix domain-containing protein [Candidatus Sumerlaeota bacterium]